MNGILDRLGGGGGGGRRKARLSFFKSNFSNKKNFIDDDDDDDVIVASDVSIRNAPRFIVFTDLAFTSAEHEWTGQKFRIGWGKFFNLW